MALMTGGNPVAHSVFYDVSYSRALWAPGTACDKSTGKPVGPPGAQIPFDESCDYNMSDWLGGGTREGDPM